MSSKGFLLFSLIFILTTTVAIAQKQIQTHVNLKWHTLKKLDDRGVESSQIISFENAIGSEIYAELPCYFKQIPIAPDEEISVQIKNTHFIEVPDSFLTLFPSLNNVDSVFSIKTQKYSSAGNFSANIFIEPFRIKGNKIQKLTAFDLDIKKKVTTLLKGSKGKTYAGHSVLHSGNWYKVRIKKDGVYKIDGNTLASMGFSVGMDIDNVKVYGNGGGMLPESNSVFYPDDLLENAIEVHDQNNNGLFDANDYLLFYGQGPNPWKYNSSTKRFYHSQHLYDNYAYYFITVDNNGGGKRVQTAPSVGQSPNKNASNFVDYAFHDKDSVNLVKSGRVWYGENFNIITKYNFSYSFSNIDPNEDVYFKANAIARSFSTSTLKYQVNGNKMNSYFSPVINHYLADYAKPSTDQTTFKTSGSKINISISYQKPNSSSQAWLNYFELNVVRKLIMTGNQMAFRNTETIGTGNITQFTLSNVNNNTRIWDVTKPTEPIIIPSSYNNSKLSINVRTDSLRQFVALNGGYHSVEKVGKVANQDLHEMDAIDYVIVYNSKFKSEAEELADFHLARSNMNILTVDQNIIFNEFSSGAKDIAALRNFMRMLYDRAAGDPKLQPKYLLLFGDASFDPKNRLTDNTNYILTFESSQSLSPTASFASDDFFGLLDSNEGPNASGSLDIGIGRFPVTTTDQAKAILHKIFRYYAQPGISVNNGNGCSNGNGEISNLSDWRNINCFIGDDEDSNTHLVQADYLANYVWTNYPVYNIDKIFFDAYPQIITPGGQRYPGVKAAIKNRVEAGALIMNYTGHGGEEGWAHESVLEVSDILSWQNKNNMPLFVTATCEFSRYDDPKRTSAGELVLLHANGGGIGLLTTSRVTYSSTNFVLSKVIYQNIFKENNGEFFSLGDIIRISKNGAGNVSANRNFVLLGDPALVLAYPKDEVITTSVTDANTNLPLDTLKALAKVTIKGEVHSNGSLANSFNGFVFPSIYDKSQYYETLVNDADSKPYTFKLQKNIIYKGKAEVKNGKFSFTFVVPKDISYKLGDGKISYYAHNGITDANGYYDSLLIGSSLSNADADITGPEIRLFINDTNFISGGITDENPNLVAFVFDEHGINTVGNGIGHDIVATLDENSSNPIVLNNFYESELNDYQHGKIQYPFSNLSVGNHTLSLKVWDVYNNSALAHTEFIVADGEEMALDNLLNAPNPFSESTSFLFEHNQSCDNMNVEIEIYNSMGQLVRIIKANVNSTGYRVGAGQVSWNGRNNNGERLAAGIYIYRIKAENSDGNWIEKSNKMVLLRSN